MVRLALGGVGVAGAEGGAEVEHPVGGRRHIAAGAHHPLERGRPRRQAQPADLAAHRLQRQGRGLGEAPRLGGGGDHHLVGELGLPLGEGQPPPLAVALKGRDLTLPEADPRCARQPGAQRQRPHPGRLGVLQRRRLHRHTGGIPGRLGVEPAHHRLGQRVVGQEACLAALLLLAQRQLQHAAAPPHPFLGVEAGEPAAAVQEPGQVDAALAVGIGGELDVEGALQGELGQLGAVEAVDQRHLDPAAGQGGGGAGPGDTGADHRHPPRRPGGRRGEPGGVMAASLRRWRRDLAAEHLALAPEARRLAPGEAGRRKAALDHPGAGEGGEGGAGAGACRHGGEQLGPPHLGVPGRREAVQEPGVDPALEQRQALGGVAQVQVQGDSVIQPQAVDPGHRPGPLCDQDAGALGQVGPGTQRPGQVLAGEGKLLGGDQVEARPGRGMGGEAGPGAEHVEPGAAAGLADHEGAGLPPGGEALGQAVAGQEDMLGLGAAVVAREVDIVEGGRVRHGLATGVVPPVEAGGLQGGEGRQAIGGGGHGGSGRWSGCDRWGRGGRGRGLPAGIRGVSTALSTAAVQNRLWRNAVGQGRTFLKGLTVTRA